AGFANSDVAVGTYTLNILPWGVEGVTFTPVGGAYTNAEQVELSSNSPSAVICYALNGSNPSCSMGVCGSGSITYEAGHPIDISVTGTTVMALACDSRPCGRLNSSVSSATFDLVAAGATATPPDGTTLAAGGASIELKSDTHGGEIHYTLDG